MRVEEVAGPCLAVRVDEDQNSRSLKPIGCQTHAARMRQRSPVNHGQSTIKSGLKLLGFLNGCDVVRRIHVDEIAGLLSDEVPLQGRVHHRRRCASCIERAEANVHYNYGRGVHSSLIGTECIPLDGDAVGKVGNALTRYVMV